MYMYCKPCRIAFTAAECPRCGNRHIREVEDMDECFLLEQESLWGDMLATSLRQSSIPYLIRPVLGAGAAMRIGPLQERYRFSIPYIYLMKAKAIAEDLLPAVSAP